MRLLAAVLVVAALLWWLLQEEGAARRARTEEGAQSEFTRTKVEPERKEERKQEAVGESEAEPAATKPRSVVRGRVQIRGRRDAPLGGITFKSLPDGLRFSGPTDDLGWTDWTSARPLPPGQVIVDSFLGLKHVVELPITTIRFPNLIPLAVEFLDVQTGVVLEEGSISLSTDRGKTVHGVNGRTILHAPILPGRTCDFRLKLVPPKGTTGEYGLLEPVRCYISGLAHAAHLRIPAWPLMRLMLEFRDESGALAEGVRLDSILLNDKALQVTAGPSDAAGRMTVRGIPYIRYATLRIRAGGIEYSFRVRRNAQYVRLSPNHGKKVPTSPPTVPKFQVVPEPGSASLMVEARWLDRERATDVPVALIAGEVRHTLRTGAESGAVQFGRLPAGELRVAVLDPALAYEERGLSLREGGKMSITLGPAQGRSLTFVVRGREPVAGARITATGWYGPIAPPLRHGVQELAAITAAGGVYIWHGFPVTEVQIEASRGREQGNGVVGRGVRSDRSTITIRRRPR